MMDKAGLQKNLSDTIGRNFNLVFNQIAMYNVYHKSVVGSLERVYESFQDGFKALPTIALSLHQDQLFVEDEALDSRINTNRLTAHFKKTDIQSLAFEAGITLADMTQFLEILTDLNRYPNADAMKKAVQEKGLEKILINYFVYQKIKNDEEVVKSNQVTGEGSEVSTTEDFLAIMAADILSEEARNNISVQNLMQGPEAFSQMLIEEDLAAVRKVEDGSVQPGTALVQSLNRFQEDVDMVIASKTDVNVIELAEDIFKLKHQLIQGIEEQKAQGVVYLDRQIIDREVDEVADGVLIRLITEEYNQGAVSIKRLAQIVLRITTDTTELQRIIPKLKRVLLDAGMPMMDYLQFVQELKNELQSDELTRVLEQSAEAIGLEGEDLIQEIVKNPQGTAELIYLAAEIRKSGQDDRILSDLLVDYVERAGTELTLEAMKETGDVAGGKVNSLFSQIRTGLVDKLKNKDIDVDVLKKMEERLTERMEESIRHLKSTMVFNQMRSEDGRLPTKADILKLLKTHAKDDDELKAIVLQVKATLAERGVQESMFQEIYDGIMTKPVQKERKKSKFTPPGSLNQGSTLFVLEKEILRANRYDTPFSLLSFTVAKAVPKEAAIPGSIAPQDIIAVFVGALTDIVRETDLVGMLGSKMVVVIQPMTTGDNAKIALERISKLLRSHEMVVNEIPFDFNFLAIVTPFDAERTIDLKTFVKVAQSDLKLLADRISNIQGMV
ncbi:MAG: hypothetical protein QNK29_10695 [Desulfobacterales bacterium]|nr:hypothetical protein [Desulfobacterales bacterium]MDX2512412.1 hypothetical protein [Desulfobacterales bacterium]